MNFLNNQDIEIINNIAKLKTNFINSGKPLGINDTPNSFKNPDSEFREYRIYNNGDPTRFIDWKIYARREKFYLKNFIQQKKMTSNIFLDTSASVNYNLEYNRFFIKTILYLSGVILARCNIVNLCFYDEMKNFSERKFYNFDSIIELDSFFSKIKFTGENIKVDYLINKFNEKSKDSILFFCSDLFFNQADLKIISSSLSKVSNRKIIFHIFENNLPGIVSNNMGFSFIDSETKKRINFENVEFKKIILDHYKKWLYICEDIFLKDGIEYFKTSNEEETISQLLKI